MHWLVEEREPVPTSGGAVATPVGCGSLNPMSHSTQLVQNQGVSFSDTAQMVRHLEGSLSVYRLVVMK